MLPGLVGTLQALEALKLLLGAGEPAAGRLVHLDTLGLKTRQIKIARNPSCPHCSAAKAGPPPKTPPALPSISVAELRALLEANAPGVLLDVREADEHARRSIEGSRLLPLSAFPAALDDLDKDTPYWVHCKSGARSARAVARMIALGFRDVSNVTGGIEAWQGGSPS